MPISLEMKIHICFLMLFLTGCVSFSPNRFGDANDEQLRRDAKTCEFETKKSGIGGINGQDIFDTCMESKGHRR